MCDSTLDVEVVAGDCGGEVVARKKNPESLSTESIIEAACAAKKNSKWGSTVRALRTGQADSVGPALS